MAIKLHQQEAEISFSRQCTIKNAWHICAAFTVKYGRVQMEYRVHGGAAYSVEEMIVVCYF